MGAVEVTIAEEAGPGTLGWRLRRRARLEALGLHDRLMDGLRGVRTTLPEPLASSGGTERRNSPYEPISYVALDMIARRLRLGPDDHLHDIGCGLGRVLCYFARRPVRRLIGVELNHDLGCGAMENAARMRGRRAPIEVRIGDAAEQSYADGTVFFLFNPFSGEVLQTVLERIAAETAGRRVRVVYVNPKAGGLLDQADWLQRSGPGFMIPQRRFRIVVQMWESRVSA